jgi:hypothetical protein
VGTVQVNPEFFIGIAVHQIVRDDDLFPIKTSIDILYCLGT